MKLLSCLTHSALLIVLAIAQWGLAASLTPRTRPFMQPFYMYRSTVNRGIYTVRLDLHLFREVKLRNYHVTELYSRPISDRELEFQLRWDREWPNFLHLGPTEDDMPGFAVAFPIAGHWQVKSDRIFALLTVHPRKKGVQEKNNFPTIGLHGYARVEDFDGRNIERRLTLVRNPEQVSVGAGHVLSLEKIYDEILEYHPF